MKKTFRLKFILLILCSTFLTLACSDSNDDNPNVEKIDVAGATNDTIYIPFETNEYQLKVETQPSTNNLRYYSNNQAVFTVNNTGLVTPVEGGSALLTIVAPNGNDWTTKTVCIMAAPRVVGIKASSAPVVIGLEKTIDLYTIFKPYSAKAKDTKMTFTVSEASMATVDANGILTAKGRGLVTITAVYTLNPEITATKDIKIQTGYEIYDKKLWIATTSSWSFSMPPEYIIDDKTNTHWHSSERLAIDWVLIDTKVANKFNIITLRRRNSDAKTVEIQVSSDTADGIDGNDDSKFTTVHSFEYTNDGSQLELAATLGTIAQSRYVRLYLPDSYRGNSRSLTEVTLTLNAE